MEIDPAFQPTPLAALVQLLVKLFSSAVDLKKFVRSYKGMERIAQDLPGDNVPVAAMADALSLRLQEDGLITREFFAALSRKRPFRLAEIQQVAEVWGIQLAVQQTPHSPWSRRATIVGALCLGSALAVVAASMLISGPPSEPASPPALERISLGGNELDPIELTVASAKTGEGWVVLVSKYRTAESAARSLFHTIRLENAPQAKAALSEDRFELCQGVTCYDREILGTVINGTKPVRVVRTSGPGVEMLPVPPRKTPGRNPGRRKVELLTPPECLFTLFEDSGPLEARYCIP